MSTYAKANRTAQWFGNKFGSSPLKPNCCVWHSTETFGWPGYSGGSMAPGYTVLPNIAKRTVSWRAHFEDEESSRALVNAPGGVETNTANAIQIEIIGTCNPAWAKTWPGTSKRAGVDYLYLPDAPEWFLAALADFVRDMHRRHGIPMTSSVSWAAYPGSYGLRARQRMSFAQWRAFVGHCGHQHVPENDHGDPGALPMGRILTIAAGGKPAAATPAPTQEVDPMPTPQDLWNADIIPAPKANVAADPKNTSWTPSSYLFYTYASLSDARAEIAGLSAAVKALAESKGASGDAVVEAVRSEVAKAMQGLEVTLTTPPA